ncbi:MAG TPA: S8 family serine peptidase [Myxococcales bacterium]|nr:S8 family serine peptidase [Myxococcales bacterium]
MKPFGIGGRQVAGPLVALLGLAGPAGAVDRVTQVIDGLPQVIAPQQIIVSCASPVLPLQLLPLPDDCLSALASLGVGLQDILLGQSVFNLVQLGPDIPLQGTLDTLRAATGIASADPNRIFLGSTTYPQTWHFPAAGAPGDSTLLSGSAAPIVAVLDTGVAYEDCSGAPIGDLLLGLIPSPCPGGPYARAGVFSNTQFAPGRNFVNPYANPDDDNGHGTAMASIIAGQGYFSSDQIPYVGPAAGAVIMPVKVLDADNRGTEFWLEEGIRYAVDNGAQVINLSLDFARNYTPSVAMTDAIAHARANHVVIVGASGNTGGRQVLHPAAFPDVLSVGAFTLDATEGYAVTYYSAFGEALDLVGPGGDPHQDVNGDGLFDGALGQSFTPGSPTDIGWWVFAGTSPATAHVSAAAAALIGAGVAPDAVRPLLQATADDDIGRSGWDRFSGSGRVQASAALAQANNYVAPAPLYADAVAALRFDGRAAGAVMIADADGNPVPNALVYVRWRGAAPDFQRAMTDSSGIARFVSPSPSVSRKIFLIEVPRVIHQGVPQRPRAFARSNSGFGSLTISLGIDPSGSTNTQGLDIWGDGYSGGVGIASGTTGSGIASGTTGSTGDGEGNATPSYPLTTGIAACPISLPLYSYGFFSFAASRAFFSGAFLTNGFSVRTIDPSWVVTPGAAALDSKELARICGVSVLRSTSLSTGYFTSGTLFVAGSGPQPPDFGAGYNARFWSEILNAEGATAP